MDRASRREDFPEPLGPTMMFGFLEEKRMCPSFFFARSVWARWGIGRKSSILIDLIMMLFLFAECRRHSAVSVVLRGNAALEGRMFP